MFALDGDRFRILCYINQIVIKSIEYIKRTVVFRDITAHFHEFHSRI